MLPVHQHGSQLCFATLLLTLVLQAVATHCTICTQDIAAGMLGLHDGNCPPSHAVHPHCARERVKHAYNGIITCTFGGCTRELLRFQEQA